MGKIHNYTQQEGLPLSGNGRAATAADFGADTQGVGQAFSELGAFFKQRAEQSENLWRVKAEAEGRAQWTERVIKAQQEAPEGAPDFTKKLLEEYTTYMDGALANAPSERTRELLRADLTALKGQLTAKGLEFEAVASAKKVRRDFEGLHNANMNTLLLDPTQFNVVLETTRNSIAGLNLPAEAKSALYDEKKMELTTAAVRGDIRINPEAAKQKLIGNQWGDTLDALKQKALIAEAEEAVRAKRIDENLKRQEEAYKKAQAEEAAGNEWLSTIVSGKATAGGILADNRMDWKTKRTMLSIMDAEGSRTDPINKAVYNSLVERVYLPDGDPRRITNENDINQYATAAGGHALDAQHVQYLRGIVQSLRKPAEQEEKAGDKLVAQRWGEYERYMRGTLVKNDPMGVPDAEGEQNLYANRAAQRAKFDAGVVEGKDPVELLTPGTKDFIGYVQRKPLPQLMQEMADRMRQAKGVAQPDGSVPDDMKRKPGETIDAYKARVKLGTFPAKIGE